MMEPNSHRGVQDKEAKLRPRDWILLPLLSLVTICLVATAVRSVARRMFPERPNSAQLCMVLDDPSTGVRGKPNTTCSQIVRENSMAIEYQFNSCGHRAGMECGLKPPDTYRIVMTGSSFAFGLQVPAEDTFATLLPKELSRRTGRNIQLYNEAMEWGFPHGVLLRFNDVLAAKPDMILWVLTPYDIEEIEVVVPERPSATPEPAPFLARNINRAKLAFASNSIPGAIVDLWNAAVVSALNRERDSFTWSPSGFLLHHFLYASQSLYMKSYLMNDDEAGYLRAEPSGEWKSRLRQFDRDAEEIESQARSAGVPLVAVLVPDRGQAAMISSGEWTAGYDPYKLDNELRSVIESHGGTYVDILPDLRTVPNPAWNYFPADGHPDADGQAMISALLAKALTNGAVPALRGGSTPQVAGTRGQ